MANLHLCSSFLDTGELGRLLGASVRLTPNDLRLDAEGTWSLREAGKLFYLFLFVVKDSSS